MKISLIVAMDAESGIGKNNDLMWHLPADMQFFKTTTKGHVVIMGRKNYDSIPEKFRPLPGRENVILTRQTSFEAKDCLVFHNFKDCLEHYKNETDRTIFIIGGGEIYQQAIAEDFLDEMFITHVNGTFEADTFFPAFEEKNWQKEKLFDQPVDEKHKHSFEVFQYKRLR